MFYVQSGARWVPGTVQNSDQLDPVWSGHAHDIVLTSSEQTKEQERIIFRRSSKR